MKTFVDIFAGLGGFHLGLSKYGMKCVFASEIDSELANLYERNFGIKPHGDIRTVKEQNIPPHDILCAGFPCQPFSSAGKKQGSKCPKSGKLIDEVFRIVSYHRPSYILLENVPQIRSVQNGEFWNSIIDRFNELKYNVTFQVYSPNEFGIPQNRKRIFIVASHRKNVYLPIMKKQQSSIYSILFNDDNYREVEEKKKKILNHWAIFLKETQNISSRTILASEFGATYPLSDLLDISVNDLRKLKGAFGKSMKQCKNYQDIINMMPEYVAKNSKVPDWITSSVIYSRSMYNKHKIFLDKWKVYFNNCTNTSWQKFEWRAGKSNIDYKGKIIQFRASGIRVSNNESTPSLVAMTPTQIPIVGDEMRYLSVREASELQAMGGLKFFPSNDTSAFKAFGNAVNAKIVSFIFSSLQ